MTAKTETKSLANYRKAVTRARNAATRAGTASWVIGDAALTVATEYGENKLGQFAEDIGVELATIRSYRTTAARYPADSIARDLQSFTVYGIFNSQDDAHELIGRTDDDSNVLPWSVSEARELVKSRKISTETAIERARRNVQRLESQLADARVKLAELEAAGAEATAEVTVPEVTMPQHIIRGIPPHGADQPRTDCPTCKDDGIVPMPTPRKSRSRKAA